MKNKTVTECWNIKKSELDSAIDGLSSYEEAKETVQDDTSVKRGVLGRLITNHHLSILRQENTIMETNQAVKR